MPPVTSTAAPLPSLTYLCVQILKSLMKLGEFNEFKFQNWEYIDVPCILAISLSHSMLFCLQTFNNDLRK